MNRCNTAPRSPARRWLAAACLAALQLGAFGLAAPAMAQPVPPGLDRQARNFPDTALRGQLIVDNPSAATLNGKPVRMAPGMRLFNPQNALVMVHSVQGQPLRVNYLIEASTGMLLTAWILTPAEAALPRKGSDAVTTNIRFGSDFQPR